MQGEQQQAAEEEGEEGAKYQPQVPSPSHFSLSLKLWLSLHLLTHEKAGCPPAGGTGRAGGDETSETDGESPNTPMHHQCITKVPMYLKYWPKTNTMYLNSSQGRQCT